MAMSGETGYAGGTPEVRMEEIVPVCSKVEAGGEGCLQGVKAESRQMSQGKTVVCTGTGKDRVPARQGYEGRGQKGGSAASQGHNLHLDNRFQQSISSLKYEHRENRQNTASSATGVRAARPTRTPATLRPSFQGTKDRQKNLNVP